METTPVIIGISAVTIILIVIIRLYINKNKESPIHREDPYNDEPLIYFEPDPTPDPEEAENENDIFEEQEEERVIPDEEIEKRIDESEKELARVNNYLITNEIKNISSIGSYDLCEKILLYEFVESANDFTVDHIYQIAENRYVALISLIDEQSEMQDQEKSEEKQIMGMIECRYSIGNACFKPYEYKVETADPDGLFIKTEIRIGNYILIQEGFVDMTYIEALCNEIDKLKTGYIACINGKTIFISINRPAALTDLKTMIEILKNYQY